MKQRLHLWRILCPLAAILLAAAVFSATPALAAGNALPQAQIKTLLNNEPIPSPPAMPSWTP